MHLKHHPDNRKPLWVFDIEHLFNMIRNPEINIPITTKIIRTKLDNAITFCSNWSDKFDNSHELRLFLYRICSAEFEEFEKMCETLKLNKDKDYDFMVIYFDELRKFHDRYLDELVANYDNVKRTNEEVICSMVKSEHIDLPNIKCANSSFSDKMKLVLYKVSEIVSKIWA